ncbi:hypothetical protein DFH07DRAFT_945486 [Mycena maculata]|uniref:F-box domain-containing protein n=1 Tax=Mycena maculata TaxID=230809 RepID=A0AAD7HWN0_9AGAR|nr:hypothetical protein DFH07DRAFT_945486 [Mycena maculata]
MFSPGRLLPTELLAEIFDMCSPPGTNEISVATNSKQELERLAKKYLLQLSQVCSRWHGVAIGTPMLWSTIVADTDLWSAINHPPEILLGLVGSSIRRSGTHPIRIQVSITDDSPECQYLLEMLSRHASRWRHLYFWNRLMSLQSIAAAKGRLPLLETLHVWNHGPDLGIFKHAPRLTDITVVGPANKIPTFPWTQIQTFSYVGNRFGDLAEELTLLRPLRSHARCNLSLDTRNVALPIELPAIHSRVRALSVSFFVQVDQNHTTAVMGAIFGSLTLTRLETLELFGRSDEAPLPWHNRAFMSFASRSTLQATLTRLKIRAMVQDDEFLECLSALPLLEHLDIMDLDDEDHALITDELLGGLAWSPDPTCIIPQLASLSMTSAIQFTEDTFLEFVASRLACPRPNGVPFEIKAYWLEDSGRELEDEFFERVRELEARGNFVFSSAFASMIHHALSKGVALAQGLWFVTQCLARVSQRLPITHLEVSTLAFAVTNVFIWSMWWYKALDVQRLIPVGPELHEASPEDVPPLPGERWYLGFTGGIILSRQPQYPDSGPCKKTIRKRTPSRPPPSSPRVLFSAPSTVRPGMQPSFNR